jgi:hypothetical protein
LSTANQKSVVRTDPAGFVIIPKIQKSRNDLGLLLQAKFFNRFLAGGGFLTPPARHRATSKLFTSTMWSL